MQIRYNIIISTFLYRLYIYNMYLFLLLLNTIPNKIFFLSISNELHKTYFSKYNLECRGNSIMNI